MKTKIKALRILKTKIMSKTTILFFISVIVIGIMSCKKENTAAPQVPEVFPPIDIDGNVYDTVRIGTQVWMVQNLMTKHYNDGTPITTDLGNASWENTTSGAYAIYDDVNSNAIVYGYLYNWYAVSSGKLAPKGWHVPSEAEFNTLVDNLGGITNAGCSLKSTTLWTTPNFCATNFSGFRARPGGGRGGIGGAYSEKGNMAYFWSANSSISTVYRLRYNESNVQFSTAFKNSGLSVRCLKD